jgi:hypothetical protein
MQRQRRVVCTARVGVAESFHQHQHLHGAVALQACRAGCCQVVASAAHEACRAHGIDVRVNHV